MSRKQRTKQHIIFHLKPKDSGFPNALFIEAHDCTCLCTQDQNTFETVSENPPVRVKQTLVSENV